MNRFKETVMANTTLKPIAETLNPFMPKITRHKKFMCYCISIVSANIIRCCFSFTNIDGT